MILVKTLTKSALLGRFLGGACADVTDKDFDGAAILLTKDPLDPRRSSVQ